MHKRSYPVNEVRKKTSRVSELIHVDICGPMNVLSIRSSKYYVPFKGEHSGFCFVYCVITKLEAFWCFKDVYHQI
jgi:hypothetical protein